MAHTRFVKKRVFSKEDTKPQSIKSKPNNKKVKNKEKEEQYDKLKILYTNADQLTPTKKIELKELISRKKPHIIAICEVKPKNGKEKLIQDYKIDGFSDIYHTNVENKKGRGIVILVHQTLSHPKK